MPLSDKALRLVKDEFQKVQQEGLPEVVPTDVGLRAHAAAVAHLEACMDSLDSEDEDGEPTVEVATMAPFCGCTDCVVREVLFVAYPILTGKTYDEPVEDTEGKADG